MAESIGDVHVLTETDGPCRDDCPHPDHLTVAPVVHHVTQIGHAPVIHIIDPPPHVHRWAWAIRVSGGVEARCYDCGATA